MHACILFGTSESEKTSEVILNSLAGIITAGLTWWMQPLSQPVLLPAENYNPGKAYTTTPTLVHPPAPNEEHFIEIDAGDSVIPVMSISRREWNIFIPKLKTRQIQNLIEKKYVKRQSSQKGMYEAIERILSLTFKKNTHLITLNYHFSPTRATKVQVRPHDNVIKVWGDRPIEVYNWFSLTGDSSTLPLE